MRRWSKNFFFDKNVKGINGAPSHIKSKQKTVGKVVTIQGDSNNIFEIKAAPHGEVRGSGTGNGTGTSMNKIPN